MSVLSLTLQWVAEATAGDMVAGEPAEVIGAVTTDTRAIEPGAVFVALKGARYDGHDFAVDALRAGASAVVVERSWLTTHAAELAAVPSAGQLLERCRRPDEFSHYAMVAGVGRRPHRYGSPVPPRRQAHAGAVAAAA